MSPPHVAALRRAAPAARCAALRHTAGCASRPLSLPAAMSHHPARIDPRRASRRRARRDPAQTERLADRQAARARASGVAEPAPISRPRRARPAERSRGCRRAAQAARRTSCPRRRRPHELADVERVPWLPRSAQSARPARPGPERGPTSGRPASRLRRWSSTRCAARVLHSERSRRGPSRRRGPWRSRTRSRVGEVQTGGRHGSRQDGRRRRRGRSCVRRPARAVGRCCGASARGRCPRRKCRGAGPRRRRAAPQPVLVACTQ